MRSALFLAHVGTVVMLTLIGGDVVLTISSKWRKLFNDSQVEVTGRELTRLIREDLMLPIQM
jgi:hypothetical protein